MQILVCIKPVPDNVQLRVTEAGPQLSGVPWVFNPLDEYALELALGLKDAQPNDVHVCVLSLAEPAACKELLKKAVAAGADSAVILTPPSANPLVPMDGLMTAALLHQHLVRGAQTEGGPTPALPDIIITGQQSLDMAHGVTGPALAAHLGWPCIQGVQALRVDEGLPAGTLLAECGTPNGLETLSLLGPAVFCAIKGNKELRASNIKGVMRANKTEIPVFPLTSRPDIATATWLAHAAPPAKPAGRKLEGLTPEAAAEAAYEALKAWGAA